MICRLHRQRRRSLARLLGPSLVVTLSLWQGLPGLEGSRALAQLPVKDAFAGEPKTPVEIWERVHYLMRVGQPEVAAPFIKKFLDANPDDTALLAVRDEYGFGSLLELDAYPQTKPYARPLIEKVAAASQRQAIDPARIQKDIANLTRSREEQKVAVDLLKESGPYAIAPWIKAMTLNGVDPKTRGLLADNLCDLDAKAVPPLIAALESSDDSLVGDVARALGRIGDKRALPSLVYVASRPKPESAARGILSSAIKDLTGSDLNSQPVSPVHLLTQDARRYYTHAYRFPGDSVQLWVWDEAEKNAKAETKTVKEAESYLGLKAAGQALEVDPTNVDA